MSAESTASGEMHSAVIDAHAERGAEFVDFTIICEQCGKHEIRIPVAHFGSIAQAMVAVSEASGQWASAGSVALPKKKARRRES